MHKVILNAKRDYATLHRHPWIFSGAIRSVEGTPGVGETVAVCSAKGDGLGYGSYSPHSQIRVRMLSFRADAVPDAAFIDGLVADAVRRRAAFWSDGRTNVTAVVDTPAAGHMAHQGLHKHRLPELRARARELDDGEAVVDVGDYAGEAVALGVDVKLTLDDIRMSIVDSVENGETREALELLSEARFKIFDALVEMPGFAFLGIGRPESSGCYCKVNSYLKEVIGILANSFDYVVIDGEAGIEQIQRRVMDKVTHLLLVTDQSKKGCQVISTIKGVADDLIVYDKIGAIINRMTNPELAELIKVPGVDIVAYIPADNTFAANDIKGKSVLELPEDSLMLNGVKEALQKIEIL